MNKYNSLKEISSRQNHYVKYARDLKGKKFRENERAFIAEGKNVLREALNSSRPIRFFFITRTEFEKEKNSALIDEIIKSSQLTFLVSDSLMNYISDTSSPSGFLGIMESEYLRIEDLQVNRDSVYLLLDNIGDPGNLGTIFRICCAFKISAAILYGNVVDPYNPKTIRASAGMVFHLPFYFLNSYNMEDLNQLRERGVKIICASTKSRNSLHNFNIETPVAFILGNEIRGISEELIDYSDDSIRIPVEKTVDSLNVSIAAAVLGYKFYEKNITD